MSKVIVGREEKVYQIPIVRWDWKPWFAWYRVKLEEGGAAWFKTVYKRKCWCVISFNEYTLHPSPDPRPTG